MGSDLHSLSSDVWKGSEGPYEFHRCDFACHCTMKTSRVGIKDLCNDLFAIVHGEEEGFVVHAVGVLCHLHAGAGSHRFRGDAGQLLDVELYIVLMIFVLLIDDEPCSCEVEPIVAVRSIFLGG